MATFTHRQGQFLAFIHLYRRLHRRGPVELDLVKLGLITREPGLPRSARVAIPEEEVPELEEVEGPPW